SHSFFFLLLRPPISTLFPYTTLFRSSSCTKATLFTTILSVRFVFNPFKTSSPFPKCRSHCLRDRGRDIRRRESDRVAARPAQRRSEEHTSELQSPYDLVCRLLLEKKK